MFAKTKTAVGDAYQMVRIVNSHYESIDDIEATNKHCIGTRAF